MSLGQSIDQVYEGTGSTRRNARNSRRSIALQEATHQNANMKENLVQLWQDGEFVPELMYQHVQFRRTEKFMKNYIDTGCLVNQKMAQNSDKML